MTIAQLLVLLPITAHAIYRQLMRQAVAGRKRFKLAFLCADVARQLRLGRSGHRPYGQHFGGWPLAD